MPELTSEVQTFLAGAIVWLILWAVRKSPWGGDIDKWRGYVSAAALAAMGALAVELKSPPFEVTAFLKAWVVAWGSAVFAYNTQKRVLP